jgi:hypothetical protein
VRLSSTLKIDANEFVPQVYPFRHLIATASKGQQRAVGRAMVPRGEFQA